MEPEGTTVLSSLFVGWVRRKPKPTNGRLSRSRLGGLRFANPPYALPHNGKLSCFFAGISTFLSFSIASARAIRFLVECGMMTSSR